MNVKKAKYSFFFQKPSKTDSIPLSVTKFEYSKYKMKQEESVRSLEILLDENSTWKGHLKTLKTNLPNLRRH